MMLLRNWLDITSSWRAVFPQQRTTDRAIRQGLGALVCLGRRTLTRIIWANGGEQRNWSSEYFLHSRVHWEPQGLFAPILKQALPRCPGRLVGVAVDDTKLHKTGRCIQQAFYQRDPLSPPFHANLILGLRFIQVSLLVPLHKHCAASCRALPIGFEESPRVKRPGKNASKEEWKAYRRKRKEQNLSTHFVAMMGKTREALDDAGGAQKTLVVSTDGSFCNRTVFGAQRDRTEIVARARKDAKTTASPGVRPRSSTEVNDASCATKRSISSIGKEALANNRCGSSSWRPHPTANAKAASCAIETPLICSPPISSITQKPSCKSTSTAGRSKSITARKRTRLASDKPSCGIPYPFPDSPSSSSRPTARCYWRPYWPSAPKEPASMPSCPSGDATQEGLPALISSRYCARKWTNTPKCSSHSV
jgi:hypothetical protein